MATGTATLNFSSIPSDEATVNITGLSGLSVGSHKEAFVQGDDSTGDNDALAHKFLAVSGRFSCEYVSATEMKVYCDLLMGLATGQFTIHYATA